MKAITIVVVSIWLDILINLTTKTYLISWQAFIPLFGLVGLIYVFKYYENNISEYFITAAIAGIFYDLVLTNTGIFNLILFLMIAFITAVVASYFKPHYLVNVVLTAFNITVYLIISYGTLVMYRVYHFNFFILITGLLGSFILNLGYLSALTYIDRKRYKKRKYTRL